MYEMTRKSYAKVNVFLKIAKKRENYHELVSRFVKVHDNFDFVSFCKNKTSRKAIDIIGNFSCNMETNTVYKMYNLIKHLKNVEKFFRDYSVQIDKNIPEFAGLGGGSSNAATFLLMANECCELNLTKDEMSKIALNVGADVPFFIHEYESANVTGIGEIVEQYKEDFLDIETFTPKDIKCNTAQIFKYFREKYYKQISANEAKILLEMDSIDVLKKLDIYKANDLYEAALDVYPALNEFNKDGWFFSGSGSSFFRIKNG